MSRHDIEVKQLRSDQLRGEAFLNVRKVNCGIATWGYHIQSAPCVVLAEMTGGGITLVSFDDRAAYDFWDASDRDRNSRMYHVQIGGQLLEVKRTPLEATEGRG